MTESVTYLLYFLTDGLEQPYAPKYRPEYHNFEQN